MSGFITDSRDVANYKIFHKNTEKFFEDTAFDIHFYKDLGLERDLYHTFESTAVLLDIGIMKVVVLA